jgi:hypothetical protein
MTQQSEREAIDFRDGPYAELLVGAIKHAHELADRSHYTVALDLVRTLRPRFAEWREMGWVLNGLEERFPPLPTSSSWRCSCSGGRRRVTPVAHEAPSLDLDKQGDRYFKSTCHHHMKTKLGSSSP